ncbi:MAG: hypothetical protein ACJASQ_001249 [Crocinitomicaceae bacterium]|jgi:hypothetical protein
MIQNILFYFIIYITVIAIQYFKLKKEFVAQDPTVPDANKFKWKPVFFISTEILYSSVGFVIVLLTNQPDWNLVIFPLYGLLVVISSQISSMAERFSENSRLLTHLSIMIVIFICTIFTFTNDESIAQERRKAAKKEHIQDLKFKNKKKKKYKVIIPYFDNSLVTHLGFDKIGDRRFYYQVTSNGKNTDDAIYEAKKLFWNDPNIVPFSNKKNSKKETILKIDEYNISTIKL